MDTTISNLSFRTCFRIHFLCHSELVPESIFFVILNLFQNLFSLDTEMKKPHLTSHISTSSMTEGEGKYVKSSPWGGFRRGLKIVILNSFQNPFLDAEMKKPHLTAPHFDKLNVRRGREICKVLPLGRI